MKRSPISTLSIIVLASVLLLGARSVKEKQYPNIIFLMADDQCTYSLGCYGNADVHTPHIDQLAREGLVFDKHYNTSAICMASRASVFTGMYEYKTGCNFDHGDMHPEVWDSSYPKFLRKSGYLTAFAGKFGFVVEGEGLCESDFDFWGGGPGQTSYQTAASKSMQKYAEIYPHSTLAYGEFGRDVIRESVDQEKPFCLSISFKAPHRPIEPDPRFDSIYAGSTFTKPGNFGREHGEHLSKQSKAGRQYERFTSWNYDTDYDGVMAKYNQLIYAIDVAVGMIRAELEALGIAENTVIFYTSDNGYICGSHGYGCKVLPMEESSRVPLIIYDPRSKTAGKQERCGELTGNIDFAPSILDLAGIPIPENMDGKSLTGLLKHPDKGGHEQLAFMNVWGPGPTTSLSCLTRQYKYTYWWYGDESMEPAEELFDLRNDPLELKNQANNPEYVSVLNIMREKYNQELAKWNDEAVDYNNYRRYGTLFDRTIPLENKELKK